MDSLPPDPYLALGVARDATAAVIKTQYRKLVLKFHPDKVSDDAQKQAASDQFHKVQTAYEIVGDDDRRGRYDAQCKLSELRKDVMERSGGRGVEVRTAAMRVPTESPRGGEFYARGPDRTRVSPTYEERRPSYAQEDYFDMPPRSASRKEADHERPSSKRGSPRDEREKARTSAKASKENDRSSRKEKSRRTEKDVRRDRERKFAYATVEEDTASDSDEYERARRRLAAEDEQRRAKDAYYETAQRQKEEAEGGLYADSRAQKMFSQSGDARDYIQRSMQSNRERPESEVRPQPARTYSSRDKVETIKRNDGGRPITIRRGSGRPGTTGRDSDERKASSREKIEDVEEPEEAPRRPPPLNKTRSSPADIRPPHFDRQRSYSVQVEAEEPIKPQMKRSETMPHQHSTPHVREGRRKEPSKLRTEAKEAYPTPEASPEPPHSRKYNYGHEYADDMEFATPDGYRTEVREPTSRVESREPAKPTTRRFTRSPSPIKETRERSRNTSSKHPQQPQRTTSTQYVYSAGGQGESYGRPPPVSRENSARAGLFGEIPQKDVPSTRSTPRQHSAKYSPPPENVQYAKYDEVKMQSGFQTGYATSTKQHRRPTADSRPSYSRSGSSRPVYAQ